MRILLAHHFPLDRSPAGPWTRSLADALVLAGQVASLLTAEGAGPQPSSFDDFGQLTDEQLAEHRQLLRGRLDRAIDRFDPHVLHVQHAWVLAQLAMETGVPYVVSVWGPELSAAQVDRRYRPLVEQGLENASRVLVSHTDRIEPLRREFGVEQERCVSIAASEPPLVDALLTIYRTVLVDRFGELPSDV